MQQLDSVFFHPVFLTLLGFAVLCAAVLWVLTHVRPGKLTLHRFSDAGHLNAIGWFAIFFLPIYATLFVGNLWLLGRVGQTIAGLVGNDDPDLLRWYVLAFVGLMTTLGGILGSPLALIRVYTAERQTRTAEDSLFNDKINAAADDLAARQQVTRVVANQQGEEVVLTEWADDLVRRNGAIDRLEGLVEENTQAAQRVARMLSVYVRELSK